MHSSNALECDAFKCGYWMHSSVGECIGCIHQCIRVWVKRALFTHVRGDPRSVGIRVWVTRALFTHTQMISSDAFEEEYTGDNSEMTYTII